MRVVASLTRSEKGAVAAAETASDVTARAQRERERPVDRVEGRAIYGAWDASNCAAGMRAPCTMVVTHIKKIISKFLSQTFEQPRVCEQATKPQHTVVDVFFASSFAYATHLSRLLKNSYASPRSFRVPRGNNRRQQVLADGNEHLRFCLIP